jgi:hypothetical protein
MASVTGITAAKANDILGQSVVAGHVDSTSGHLILTKSNGTTLDGGDFTSIVSGILDQQVTDEVNSIAPGIVDSKVAAKMPGKIYTRPDANGALSFNDISASDLIHATLKVKLIGNSSITATALNGVARTPGTQFIIRFTQDATGGRTLTLTGIKRSQGILTLSTAPGAIDLISFYYDGDNWYAGPMGLNFS